MVQAQRWNATLLDAVRSMGAIVVVVATVAIMTSIVQVLFSHDDNDHHYDDLVLTRIIVSLMAQLNVYFQWTIGIVYADSTSSVQMSTFVVVRMM